MLGNQRALYGYLAMVLVALATFAVQLATAIPEAPHAWPLLEAVALIAIAMGLRISTAGHRRWVEWRHARIATLVLFIVWPLAVFVVGGTFGFGIPLEVLLLRVLQGTAMGLVAEPHFSHRRDVLAVGASAFAMVFSASIAPTAFVRPLVLAFAGMSAVWLIIQARPTCDTVTLVAGKRTGWGQGPAIAVGVVCLAATALFARPQVMAARWGWFASSGGIETFDPFARSGVGDGDALVRAEKDASSVGPISETNVFLANDTPSLYDMFNDMYGEPPKPKKTERAVPLPSDLTPRDEQQVATSKQAGREFSAVRQPPKRRDVQDRNSRAVLHLAGRTPAHLRLAAFDVFDGREWFPADEPTSPPSLTMQDRSGSPWLWLKQSSGLGGNSIQERHSVKILALDTAQIPLLAETTHLRIAQVADAGFFCWRQEGVVAMEGRESIPSLTVIDLVSDLSGGESASESTVSVASGAAPSRETSLPRSNHISRIRGMAKEWTKDCGTLEEVLAAVVTRLRDEYVLDPFMATEESAADVVGEFLFHDKRGPDYLFASSAAILLRTLGHSSRLVSGLYAAPARYDRRSGLTPVVPEDVHFWVEVRRNDGHWIPLEPTPGYELLQPQKTWSQALFAAARGSAHFVLEHWLAIAAVLCLIAFIYVQRFRLTDLLTEGYWRLCVVARPEQAIAWTLQVLEWRSVIAGRRRVSGATPQQWLNKLTPRCPCPADAHRTFLEDLAAALYGPPASANAVSTSTLSRVTPRTDAYLQVIQAYRGQRMRYATTSVDGDTQGQDALARPRRKVTSEQGAIGRC